MGGICSCLAATARAVQECCASSVYGVYAVLRNGLWEDPAEATTGTVFKRFEAEIEKAGFRQEIGPYLTWRYCYLQCSALFALTHQILTAEDLNPDRAFYDALLAEVPPGLQLGRFDTLLWILAWWNFALTAVWFVSFLLLLAAIFTARPARVVRHVALSRRLTWGSWLLNFIVPFAIFMVFPLRSVVNWSGLEADVCAVAVHTTLEMQGVDMGSGMAVLQQRGLLTPGAELLALGGSASAEVAREWCIESGTNWGSIFFDGAVQCVWEVDSSCRETVCASVPTNVQLACLSQCLNFTGRAQEAGLPSADAFMQSLNACPSGGESSSSSGGLFQIPEGRGRSATAGLNSSNLVQAFNFTAANQRVGSAQTWESAKMIIDRLEYTVGVFVAIRAGQLLLSAALSLLGGLTEALVNVKALFPGSQVPNWVLILTTFQSVPMYCCMLAFAQQMIGDHWLGIACALFAAFSSLSGMTAVSSLLLHEGTKERWIFYRKLWVEYGLRFFFGVGAASALWAFVQVNFPELENLLQLESLAAVMIVTFLSYLARKSLIAVAGTDAALTAFVQCELWQENASKEEQERHSSTVHSMGSLLTPSLHQKASAHKSVRRRAGQHDQEEAQAALSHCSADGQVAGAPATGAQAVENQASDVQMADV